MESSVYPLVSIAMCTYNGERFLREQMDSLIRQDYPNLEIIIVDDCSTDSTVRILSEYSEKYPHIRVISNERNLGFVKNFEKAISLCSGEYIALCDQDDIWFENKISTLLKNIGPADLIYSRLQIIDEQGNEVKKTPLSNLNRLEGKCHLGLLLGNCVTGHAALVRKSALEKAMPIPAGLPVHDHWIAFVTAANNGIKAYPEVLSLYRQHASNVVLGKKKRDGKFQRRLKTYRDRKCFMMAAAKHPCLSDRDRELINQLISHYNAYLYTLYNFRLYSFLNRHRQEFLKLYRAPDRRLKKICRGFLL